LTLNAQYGIFRANRCGPVLDKPREAGAHEVSFTASGLASGFHFYRLSTATGVVGTRQTVTLK